MDLQSILSEIGAGNARSRARQACWALVRHGVEPKGPAWLRENVLGKGSFDDIQAGIREFEVERAQALARNPSTQWPAEVATLFQTVWDQAQRLAESRFDSERRALLARIAELEESLRRKP